MFVIRALKTKCIGVASRCMFNVSGWELACLLASRCEAA